MTIDGVVKGTPGYMAPEQITGETKTTQTDIYSLGALLFELLYGVTPVTGDSAVSILKKTVAGKVTIPKKQVPQALRAVALKALKVDALQRYESVEEFHSEIANYVLGRATLAENASFWRLFLLLLRRNKALSLTISFFVLIFAVSTYQFVDSLQKSEKDARGLLLKLQQENKDKLTLAKDAEPRLSARIDKAFEKYNLVEAEGYIAKLSELLPASKVGMRYRGRLSFLISNYEAAQKELLEPENELDELLIEYLKSPRLRKNKVDLIEGLFAMQEHGAMIYLRSFYLTHENRMVSNEVEAIVGKWRFVQDSFHMFEIAKLSAKSSQSEILKRIYSLLSKGTWSGASTVAHAAARLTVNDELRENFLRMFTRNMALMKRVKSTGTTSAPAFNAVDGRKAKAANRWEAGPCPASLTVDLGEVREFNKILVYFRLRSPKAFQYKMSYSMDGRKFLPLIDGSKNQRVESPRALTHRFPVVKGRYVRLKILGSEDDDRAFVREFEVYKEVKNLAVGQTCWQGEELLENLTNGTSYKGAYSLVKPKEPVYIDLGNACEFQAVRVTYKQLGDTKMKVSYSNDGENFTEILFLEKAAYSWEVFKPLKGRYLKLEFTGAREVLINEIRIGNISQYPDLDE
jgi:serine/threonine protein kinase